MPHRVDEIKFNESSTRDNDKIAQALNQYFVTLANLLRNENESLPQDLLPSN